MGPALKVNQLIETTQILTGTDASLQAYRLPVDGNGAPSSIDGDRLCGMLRRALAPADSPPRPPQPLDVVDWRGAKFIMLIQKSQVNILVQRRVDTLENTHSKLKQALTRYLGISDAEYDALLDRSAPMITGGHSYENLARLVCFVITRSMQSPCLWGLMSNMAGEAFCLRDAINYIWEDCAASPRTVEEVYYPRVSVERRVLVDLDRVFANDFKSYHRSGWAYAVGGLMALDAVHILRQPSDIVMVDTYVDRTFHWGLDSLKAMGMLPYTKPWIGFVHHTFDVSHSPYNCVQLFQTEEFLQSLQCCLGLVSLTEYLARPLRAALAGCGFENVPVSVVMHPMETVDTMFTMEQFLANPDRKLVQIGAWLREAYAVYRLDMWNNILRLQKCALKGKEMDNYFRTDDLLSRIHGLLTETPGSESGGGGGSICRPPSVIVNKYCAGLYDMIFKNDSSVQIIDRLTNEEYDHLLSRNIVYLKLVDCSAVNTVLECLVRNTVIVVNRHPAVEEILGVEYPCFYSTDMDATIIINDINRIRAGYRHLQGLDKSRFTLDRFVESLQSIVLDLC